MSPAGKIINIDAFKKKESGLPSAKKPVEKKKEARRRKDRNFVVLLIFSAALALAIMMTPSTKTVIKVPPVDSIAPYNVKAPEDMLIEDRESTEKNRAQARDSVLDVYDFDAAAEKVVKTRIKEAFAFMASSYAAHAEQAYIDALADLNLRGDDGAGASVPASEDPVEAERLARRYAEAKGTINEFEKSEAFAELESKFYSMLEMELDEKAIKSARYYHYRPEIGQRLASIIGPIYARGVVARKSQLPPSSAKGINLRYLSDGTVKVIREFNEIYDLPEAMKRVREQVEDTVPPTRPGLRNLLTKMAEGLLHPNITFNKKETELRKEKAEAEAKPVFFRVQRGEMIVREGERVTPAHVAKLEYLAGKEEDRGRLEIFGGLLLLTLLVITLSSIFVNKFYEDIRGFPRIQLLLALLLVAHMGLVWATLQMFTTFLPQTPDVGLKSYMLAAPLVFGPMIVSIFFNTELTILFTIVAAALTGLLLRDFSLPSLITMTGGMMCAYQVRMYSKRSSVLRVGFMVALVNVLVVLSFGMVGERLFTEEQLNNVMLALLGGATSALFVSGALPLIESFFPVVSDIKLLEIADANHPLLRRMLMEAPGSYHHSMMVGALAEEACKAIGANSLLARAGAMFHDIGKIRKPEYFYENQRHGENPHDKLTPSMSTLILINHIKEGVELARQYKLLPQITAMIPEHHGTQLVRYFYNKAKEAEDTSRAEVKEGDFRYPGPIPSSKESAIVALADSIEAAARACQDPTPLRLKGLVKDVINDKFVQGQLDNSHLTLKDLSLIEESFIHVLTAIHHHRIQYPAMTQKEKDRKQAHEGTYTQAKKGEDTQGGYAPQKG